MRLAVGQLQTGDARSWRAGGLLIQNIAADDARGPTEEPWTRAQALFETIGEDELVDPTVSGERLLFRLFHEDGVRLFEPSRCAPSAAARANGSSRCCSPSRPRSGADMVEPDGVIRVNLRILLAVYDVAPEAVDRLTRLGVHPLDRPAWSALTTRQAHLAQGDARALRFDPDFALFAAAADDAQESLAAVSALVPPDSVAWLVETEAKPPPPGTVLRGYALCWQMLADAVEHGEPAFEVAPWPTRTGLRCWPWRP